MLALEIVLIAYNPARVRRKNLSAGLGGNSDRQESTISLRALSARSNFTHLTLCSAVHAGRSQRDFATCLQDVCETLPLQSTQAHVAFSSLGIV